MVTLTKTPTEVYLPSGGDNVKPSEIITLFGEYGVAIDGAMLSPVSSSATNTTVAATDGGKTFIQTDATTVNLPDVASAGDGFVIKVKAAGGDVALNPDGSEVIDGVETITISDTESAIVICDGSEWHAIVVAGLGTLGSAASEDVGSAIDDVVQLQDVGGVAGLPAVDGSQLTGVQVVRKTKTTLSSVASAPFTWAGSPDFVEINLDQVLPATDVAMLHLEVSTNGGVSWKTGASDYRWSLFGMGQGTSNVLRTTDASDAQVVLADLGIGTSTGEYGLSGVLRVQNPGETGVTAITGEISYQVGDGQAGMYLLRAFYLGTEAVNGVRLSADTGNLASGLIRVAATY